MVEAYYNQDYGMLVLKRPNEESIIEHHHDFIEAWKSLNRHGFECSGWVDTYLGEELGYALMATDLDSCEPFEGNP